MPHFASLTVFFPMWNEAANIHPAMRAAHEACQDLVAGGEIGDYEILLVDDASTDGTGAIADTLAAEDPRVRVIHHASNQRLGGALRTGLYGAAGELVLYSDADLPFDLLELRKACRLLRLYGADVVSAYRHDRTSEGPRRTLYSFAYNWLITLAFGLRVRDVNFSFKLFRRRVLEHVRAVSTGSFIDAELLVRAHRLGFKIIQFGVDYFPRSRGVSTLSSGATIVGILRELLALRSELARLRPLPPEVLAPPPSPR